MSVTEASEDRWLLDWNDTALLGDWPTRAAAARDDPDLANALEPHPITTGSEIFKDWKSCSDRMGELAHATLPLDKVIERMTAARRGSGQAFHHAVGERQK